MTAVEIYFSQKVYELMYFCGFLVEKLPYSPFFPANSTSNKQTTTVVGAKYGKMLLILS